jgi:hypothetical protein
MAQKAQVEQLNAVLNQAWTVLEKNLTERREWGSITFSAADVDISRLRQYVGYLRVLPLEHLPDQIIVSSFHSPIAAVVPILQQIDAFSLTAGSPTQTRDTLVSQLHAHIEAVYVNGAQWIPFLAYQKGDVTKNIEQLSESVTNAKAILDKAQGDVETKKTELDSIIIAAREASAAAGAAVFTTDFQQESTDSKKAARNWLTAAGVSATATVVVAGLFLWLARTSNPSLSGIQVAQQIGAKLIILTMLGTAATWCGRQYRTLMHLAVVNRHKALSLRTLQAFSAAGSDELTKNTIVIEATRAIFAQGTTGYVEGKDPSDDSLRIVEIAKGLTSKGAGT